MTPGKRHKLRCRRSAATGRLLLVIEHEIDDAGERCPDDLTIQELEILMNALSIELANANTAIVNLVASNATKDATITANAATIADLQSQLDVANQKDAANPLNDPDAKAAADTLNATLGTLPPDVLPPPAPVVQPADTVPATGA